jgi:prophage regulatory protein
METETTAVQPRRILRMPEVERRTGRSRTSIYRDMSEGRFPLAVKIGPRAMGWAESSIDEWIAARTRASA